MIKARIKTLQEFIEDKNVHFIGNWIESNGINNHSFTNEMLPIVGEEVVLDEFEDGYKVYVEGKQFYVQQWMCSKWEREEKLECYWCGNTNVKRDEKCLNCGEMVK